ncbi:transcriptional regulator NrdR [Candidatus Parcubacteria bacterium]|nr:MAG: transcriptional regulator NrdR [Candidatus Parcubacteria bacterium]
MKCPVCLNEDTKVVDSRASSDGFSIRRRRECLKCNFRFSTNEEVEIMELTVIKSDGTKQAYDREKIVRGVKKSLEKRPITDDGFKKLIHGIERNIQALRETEVGSEKIGKIIMKELKKVDKVAYIRFASVYESFEDVQTFQEELEKLVRKRKNKQGKK